jgi:uncharacterized phage protein (TIGR01671 family)
MLDYSRKLFVEVPAVRYIKFRVWDRQERKWDTPAEEDVHVDEDGKICVPYYDKEGTFLYSVDESSRHSVMEYTGLKDKNGKRIYEGDIVRIDGLKTNPFMVKFGPFKDRSDAGYSTIDSYGWYYSSDKLEFNLRNAEVGDTSVVEIIGNIHQGLTKEDAFNTA